MTGLKTLAGSSGTQRPREKLVAEIMKDAPGVLAYVVAHGHQFHQAGGHAKAS